MKGKAEGWKRAGTHLSAKPRVCQTTNEALRAYRREGWGKREREELRVIKQIVLIGNILSRRSVFPIPAQDSAADTAQ